MCVCVHVCLVCLVCACVCVSGRERVCVCVCVCVRAHFSYGYRCMCVQKEEMGEVLHEVDFNQLKIENQQYLEKIDERNQDLLRLKLMAGNTLQVLNSYKVTGLQIKYS